MRQALNATTDKHRGKGKTTSKNLLDRGFKHAAMTHGTGTVPYDGV